MILVFISLCIFSVWTFGGIPHTTDKILLQQEPLALVGKLSVNQTISQIMKEVTQIFYNKNLINCYLADCTIPSNPLCQSNTETGLEVYSFSRPIKYTGKLEKQYLTEWVQAILDRKTPQIFTTQQLVDIIAQNRFAFVYFPSNNTKDNQMFTTLSRKYLNSPLFIINNPQLTEKLQMKPGNLTMYKNQQLQRESFPHANSWERWQSFLATYSYPGINYLDSNHLTSQRFRQNTNIRFIGLLVDHSYDSQKHIDSFYEYSKNNTSGLQMRLYFDYLRQTQMVKIYYHIRPKQFPALVYVSLINQSLNISVRQGTFNIDDLDQFSKKAAKDELQLFYLSQPIPPNNGYSGKGVQKTIQKVVYDNFYQTVIKSRPTYIVMYTSVGQGCGNCEQSYSQFKKLKSYFQEEDIVFARYQFVNNYIPQTRLSTVPQVVIYKQDHKDKPITERYLTRFDEILRLIRQHIPLQNDQL